MQLHRHRTEFASLGVGVAVVGNGSPASIAGFRDKTGYRDPIYVDPEGATYEALGLSRSIRGSANLRTVARTIRVLRDGFRQSAADGDRWQLGGVITVRRGGEIANAIASRFAGDHPSVETMLRDATEAIDEDRAHAWA